MPNQLTCYDVADYFLSLVDDDSGDSISNLKLQKLVYYAQGLHLACFDQPLFNEDIQAWAHGPVVPELYYKYRGCGSGTLPINSNLDYDKFDDETKQFLNDIYNIYGQYSAWKLREMTHGEQPWIEANSRGNNCVISHESLKNYFAQFVEEET
jgi:uncharacterized phage-associated protein